MLEERITMKYSIQTLNKISKAGTDRFCDAYTISDDAKDPDAILVRSASLHDTSFGDNLKAIARAGAGVNNIPLDRCSEAGICVFIEKFTSAPIGLLFITM